MKLLGFVTALLFIASSVQAQLGTWPFKSGGTGGGDSSLSLEQSMAQYSLVDADDAITLTTDTDVPLVNVGDAGTWALSSETAGWTGTTSGAERGKLVRASGVATAVHIVFGQVCMYVASGNDNLNIAGYISINGTTVASSQGWVISTPNSKKVCGTMSLLTEVAASDAISIEMKRVGGSSTKVYNIASITITAFAPHYVPPAIATEASTDTLTATQVSGGIVTNLGATGTVNYTLPVAAAGMSVTIVNEAAHAIKVIPNQTAPDDITNLTTTAGDSVTSDGAITSALTLISTANNKWWGIPVGSWADSN